MLLVKVKNCDRLLDGDADLAATTVADGRNRDAEELGDASNAAELGDQSAVTEMAKWS